VLEELPVARVLAERVRAQVLTGVRPTDPVEAVLRVGALQAQDPRALRLAIRARTTGVDALAVQRALAEPGRLVVTWLMRGTLHAVPAGDVRWLLALLRPPRSSGRTRRLALGLDDHLLDTALPIAVELLAAGPLTRTELADRLRAAGVPLVPGQAPAHLLSVAAREGLVCRGPDRDGEPTYVRLSDWLPGAGPVEPVERDDALARLARRYLGGHGPAGAADLAAWSGLPLRDARTGLGALAAAGEVEDVRIGGAPAYRLPGEPSPGDRTVRLVPAFDEYLLGYRGRALALDAAYARRIQAGGGIVHPAVLLGGRIIGTWRQRRADGGLIVAVEPFRRLPRGTRAALAAEAADVGRFLGVPARLEVGNSPVPVDA
jgi:Winged helix DNA-binding domain